MQKLLFLSILSYFLSIYNLHAYNTIDSIGVENNNGKKLILHKIESKETYYSVGRKYNVSPKDIISFNDNKTLQPGNIIKVPTPRPFVLNEIKTPASVKNTYPQTSTTHTVKAKENLSQIAEKYGISIADLRDANGISGSNLSIGQLLKIPVVQPTESTNAAPLENTAVSNLKNSDKTIEHTVAPKEFLNKIAEQYNTTVEVIKRLNNLTNNNLSIGQILKVPAPEGTVINSIPTTTSSTLPIAVQKPEKTGTSNTNKTDTRNIHTVIAGETIFSIAQKYSVTAYQLRQSNNLGDNTISIGQKLIVPSLQTARSVPETAFEDSSRDPSQTIKTPTLKKDPSVYGLNEVEEKGIAIWISDVDLDATKMLVLHRTLPAGSILKITNPMSNITTLAKVVGKFTENETTKDVIIVTTKAVADKLGVLDKRFFCNITYAVQENEQ